MESTSSIFKPGSILKYIQCWPDSQSSVCAEDKLNNARRDEFNKEIFGFIAIMLRDNGDFPARTRGEKHWENVNDGLFPEEMVLVEIQWNFRTAIGQLRQLVSDNRREKLYLKSRSRRNAFLVVIAHEKCAWKFNPLTEREQNEEEVRTDEKLFD